VKIEIALLKILLKENVITKIEYYKAIDVIERDLLKKE